MNTITLISWGIIGVGVIVLLVKKRQAIANMLRDKVSYEIAYKKEYDLGYKLEKLRLAKTAGMAKARVEIRGQPSGGFKLNLPTQANTNNNQEEYGAELRKMIYNEKPAKESKAPVTVEYGSELRKMVYNEKPVKKKKEQKKEKDTRKEKLAELKRLVGGL